MTVIMNHPFPLQPGVMQACHCSGLFTNLSLPQNVCEEVATKFVSKPVPSCWDVESL